MAAIAQSINGLAVAYRDLAELKPHPGNAKTHSPKQVGHIVRSMTEFGWTNPILVDEEGNVLAGHGRLEAAKRLGMTSVPTICISHMTAAQKRAYIIADNRMNEIAGGWDSKVLALEHQAIRLLDPTFDISLTGFTLDDVEIISTA